jgi:diguanylate cyclase (GGDEF)-like protein
MNRLRSVPFWLAPILVAAGALVATATLPAMRPFGLLPRPALLALCGLGMAASALHRPRGGTALGLGAAFVPLALASFGPWPTAVLAAGALAAAEAALRALERRSHLPLPERRTPLRAASHVALAALSALASGAVWRALDLGDGTALPLGSLAIGVGLAAVAWWVPPVAAEGLAHRLQRAERFALFARSLLPFAVDLAGWGIGLLVLADARAAGWPLAIANLAVVSALAAEAARNGFLTRSLGRRLEESHRVRHAGHRIAAGASGLERIAGEILAACRDLVPFSWFQFELVAGDDGPRSFFAESGGALLEGVPEPPSQPPALPGIHRRGAWQVLERELASDGHRLGRLRFWCDPRRVEPRAIEMFDALVPQIASSVRGALADRAARVDRLTGTALRRVLEERLAEAFDRSREEGTPFAVVLCDLDHFKRINDRYGHATGDLALQAVAAVLLAPARGGDLVARYGGEEFVLLFEGTDGDTALEIAERLRKKVEALTFEGPAGEPVALTMSAGVAAFPELHVRRASDLLELADAALYTSKHLGRNVCLLDIGRGRVRTPRGEELQLIENPAPQKVPTLFA